MENITGKKSGLFLIISLLVIGGFYLLNPELVKAGREDNLSGFAYSSNIGWVSFNSTNCDPNEWGVSFRGPVGCPPPTVFMRDYGVNLDINTGKFSGHAWFSSGLNVGNGRWITFERSEAGTPPASPFNGAEDFLAYYQTGESGYCGDGQEGQVCGWARALCNGGGCGGWDGWIKIKGSTHSVYLNESETPKQFHGYAWGGDPEGVAGDSVIGWLSWNCAEGGDDQPGGSNICGTSDYKVIYTPTNPAPTATSLSYTEGDYCTNWDPPIYLSWTFSDSEDSQSAYQIQIDDDPNFATPQGCPGLNDTKIASSGGPTFTCIPQNLSYGKTYYWRLMVWDSQDKPSNNWINAPDTFATSIHRWPRPDFIKPSNPEAGQELTFEDNGSGCWNNTNEEELCLSSATSSYQWDFDIATSLIDCNYLLGCKTSSIIYTYNIIGKYEVKLEITDNAGACYITKDLLVIPKPEWKEIPPSGRLLNGVKNIFANISNFFNKIFPI